MNTAVLNIMLIANILIDCGSVKAIKYRGSLLLHIFTYHAFFLCIPKTN
jgi:hypothetical protein